MTGPRQDDISPWRVVGSCDTPSRMKVFISSVIVGLESYRDAADTAARALRHEVKRAEDFGASPDSPQQACLTGVRLADVVVLLLGERYGQLQASGLSATHEEFREAREHSTVLAFAQQGVEREEAQQALLAEVRDWTVGVYTAGFSTPAAGRIGRRG